MIYGIIIHANPFFKFEIFKISIVLENLRAIYVPSIANAKCESQCLQPPTRDLQHDRYNIQRRPTEELQLLLKASFRQEKQMTTQSTGGLLIFLTRRNETIVMNGYPI
jgi:hypothetical protein